METGPYAIREAIKKSTKVPEEPQGGMISEGGVWGGGGGGGEGSIWLNYRASSIRTDRPANSADLDAVSDQDLHCLPLTQQFYTHSQIVKWTSWREV